MLAAPALSCLFLRETVPTAPLLLSHTETLPSCLQGPFPTLPAGGWSFIMLVKTSLQWVHHSSLLSIRQTWAHASTRAQPSAAHPCSQRHCTQVGQLSCLCQVSDPRCRTADLQVFRGTGCCIPGGQKRHAAAAPSKQVISALSSQVSSFNIGTAAGQQAVSMYAQAASTMLFWI